MLLRLIVWRAEGFYMIIYFAQPSFVNHRAQGVHIWYAPGPDLPPCPYQITTFYLDGYPFYSPIT